MSDFGSWAGTIPRFTRLWLGAAVTVSLVSFIGILPPYHLILSWEKFAYEFQIWRPITSLFFYPLGGQAGFNFLVNCYFIYNYGLRLERDHYKQSPSDYFFLLVFCWVCLVLGGFLFSVKILMDSAVVSIIYIWCNLNKETIVSFWFGSKFKAVYLPWVLLVLNFIMSHGSFSSLLGIVVGHLYYFTKYQYPQEHGGKQLLNTPQFLKRYFPDTRSVHGFFGVPPASTTRANPPAGGNRFFQESWGSGNALGRN